MKHHAEVEKAWQESQKNHVMERLRQGEEIQTIMETLPGFREAFARKLDTIVCSDERVPAGADRRKIGIAGSLGLARVKMPAEFERFIAEYRGKIREVTSHDDCGAADKAFQLLKAEDRPEGVVDADTFGKWHAKDLADKLAADYRHITMEEMRGKIHDARIIFVDHTGRFEPAVIAGLPPHFICSGPGFKLSPEYCKEEQAILSGISQGGHGLGASFTEADPLYVVVVHSDPSALATCMTDAESAVRNCRYPVVVKGLVFSGAETV